MARLGGLGVALAATGAAQALATLGLYALPVLVSYAAPEFGVPPEAIGYQVGLVYLCAALASAYGPRWLARWGPARTTQVALLAAAAGTAMLAAGRIWLAVPASALLGLGYGLTNPAAAQVLGRLVTAGRRNLVFAVKQMGVPLGLAAGGLLLPRIAEAGSWRLAMLVAAGALATMALALGPMRAAWDRDRSALPPAAGPGLLRRAPALTALAVTGGAYGVIQVALGAHMVAMLVGDFLQDPVTAGALVGLSQAMGALGRVGWAMWADARLGGLRALVLIGLGSGLFLLLLPILHGAETWLVALVFAGLGATTAGWNGVLVAESVRLAPPGAAGAASGAVLSVTFGGAVLGPPAMAVLGTLMGGYAVAFAWLALLPLGGAAVAWAAGRRGAVSGRRAPNR
ncbi:MFS transporter [Roseomonas sp. HF4]|uniref:MFS transporter n=1 Tax=Roseomonas sp. HF4 TaxID=2562313 RepID=UPI001484F502|nr:MFS transporter [Roseomonas sp. HF4]